MIDLPTAIALLAPVLGLFACDQVIRRVLAWRRPRAEAAGATAPSVRGPAALPIASRPSARATDRPAAAEARRVA